MHEVNKALEVGVSGDLLVAAQPLHQQLGNGNSSWWRFRRNLPAKERAQRKSQECPRLPVDKLSIPSFTHLVDITSTNSPTYLPLDIEPPDLISVIFSPQMYFWAQFFLHMEARKLWQNFRDKTA